LYLQNETDFLLLKQRRKFYILHQNRNFTNVLKTKNIAYTTTDLVSPLADVKADICNLPFEDNAFDIIFAIMF